MEKKKEKIIGKIAVSNRHLHLTKEIYDELFDEPLSIKRPLNQIGEFASFQTVTLKTEKGEIPNVRLIGPLRKYNQVEISRSDAYLLGINPPVRESGDLEDSEMITIVGPKGEVTLKDACIQAERHVHMNEKKAEELGLKGSPTKVKKSMTKEAKGAGEIIKESAPEAVAYVLGKLKEKHYI